MPEINLDVLVPEDIVFTFRDHRYAVPGDLDVDTSLKLVDLFVRAGEAEESGDVDRVATSNRELVAFLLELFRRRDPDLEELPFGVIAYRAIVGQLLVAVGLQIDDGTVEGPTRPTRKQATVRSRRSTGSRK